MFDGIAGLFCHDRHSGLGLYPAQQAIVGCIEYQYGKKLWRSLVNDAVLCFQLGRSSFDYIPHRNYLRVYPRLKDRTNRKSRRKRMRSRTLDSFGILTELFSVIVHKWRSFYLAMSVLVHISVSFPS